MGVVISVSPTYQSFLLGEKDRDHVCVYIIPVFDCNHTCVAQTFKLQWPQSGQRLLRLDKDEEVIACYWHGSLLWDCFISSWVLIYVGGRSGGEGEAPGRGRGQTWLVTGRRGLFKKIDINGLELKCQEEALCLCLWISCPLCHITWPPPLLSCSSDSPWYPLWQGFCLFDDTPISWTGCLWLFWLVTFTQITQWMESPNDLYCSIHGPNW